ncbi:hypothetical protein A3J43_00845 [Candidatus Uhrbacteria bacterium RIFCSPHIGHO2_12_FULL_54_23]|uniref:tRNA-dihydrouridine synthase n=3 Tax=Candidatus Uhriibacteriota TaxID=1752732 RepID=A0A1F7UMB8_9BACT|nr:MAG: hypothetical protein A3J43_00845 [Candidatus Uhrbacteria bacterium RIFCSPHIGHO2_12_FULL_54_23]OGL85565.1 MAG: hypothetical protein A3B36_00720 [Candidatus Uhrbacteria bacterium RIFCSPLOWO2_01_FULL_55_36]OGL90799.1 MAG: hypothetical protein A3J36_03400 [Candidatus Uhrbacteria bacterium RIFCSPLOWO2_02_FULL_54_37]
MENFWQHLPTPFLALAPMAGVTDLAFRTMCKRFGADVIYTEFASANALVHGNAATRRMISFHASERPVVCQIFGNDPAMFAGAARVLEAMGFDGIDINFGCPAYKVVTHGGGVVLMRDLDLCYALVKAACEATTLPVSIKIRSSINGRSDCARETRASPLPAQRHALQPRQGDPAMAGNVLAPPAEGFSASSSRLEGKVTALDLVERIRDLPVAALMIHGRTYEKPFDGAPDVGMIRKVRERFGGILIANGGVYAPEAAQEMFAETGADGVGIGRGAHGRPWIFSQTKEYLATGSFRELSWDEKKQAMRDHARLAFAEGGAHGLLEMRKHLAWYVKGIYNASELRHMLVQTKSLEDVEMALARV